MVMVIELYNYERQNQSVFNNYEEDWAVRVVPFYHFLPQRIIIYSHGLMVL